MEEREPAPESADVAELLEDWREAERDADAEAPNSAAARLAHQNADAARDEFHDAEDEERERQGDHRPRTHKQSASD